MKNKNFLDVPFVLPAIVLSVGLLVAALIGAITFYQSRSLGDVLSVTGSAKTRVTSDSVKWTFNISRRVTENTLQAGYAKLAGDLTQTKIFLNQNGIKENQVTITPIFMEEMYKDPSYSGPREVTLRQMITVQSGDIQGITQVAKNTEVLAKSGIFLSTGQPEYYYSKLSELRVSLLSDAVKDAKARAEQIAKSSGQSIGSLKAASSGVVQVLQPNSVEIADYGSYDTSSIEKDVMVTVRASFSVR